MLGDMGSDRPITREDMLRMKRGRLKPVSAPQGIPPPERFWSDRDWLLIQRGHRAADMDDKWDAFVEGQRLYLHRSWTGLGVYEAELARGPDGWRISGAVVESDSGRYKRREDAYESALLEVLVDWVLCRRPYGPGHQRLERIRAERGRL